MQKTTIKSFRLSDVAADGLASAQQVTGASATSIVESALADYSFRYRLMARMGNAVKAAALSVKVKSINDDMLLGITRIRDWHKSIPDMLSVTEEVVMLKESDQEDSKQIFDEMLVKLRDRIDQRIETGTWD